MAVSFTAFLAGIDAEIRTVITAMTAERSSAAGAYRKCQIYTFGIVQIWTNDLAYKMQCDSNSNKTGTKCRLECRSHTDTMPQNIRNDGSVFWWSIDFSSPNCFVRSLTEIEKAL